MICRKCKCETGSHIKLCNRCLDEELNEQKSLSEDELLSSEFYKQHYVNLRNEALVKKRSYLGEYYQKNKSKINERNKKWSKENSEFVREYNRKWGKLNKTKRDAYKANYRARKHSLPETLTKDDIDNMLDYFNHSCAVCERPFDLFTRPELDHWIPLTSADCPGTIPTNIVPLCGNRHGFVSYTACNPSKSNKDAEQWLIDKYGKTKAKRILKQINKYFEFIDSNRCKGSKKQ